MDFVNKIGDTVNKAAKVVVKGTNNFVESTKLSVTISEYNDRLNAAYADIGKKIYLSKVTGIELDTDFEEELSEIQQLNTQIDELKERMLDIKNKKKCTYCGAEVFSDDVFCRKCGNRVD